jgi:hypothetical protein
MVVLMNQGKANPMRMSKTLLPMLLLTAISIYKREKVKQKGPGFDVDCCSPCPVVPQLSWPSERNMCQISQIFSSNRSADNYRIGYAGARRQEGDAHYRVWDAHRVANDSHLRGE